MKDRIVLNSVNVKVNAIANAPTNLSLNSSSSIAILALEKSTSSQSQSSGMVTTGGFDLHGPGGHRALGPEDASLANIPPTQTLSPIESQYSDQAQFEADKRAVYKHPLFPLLALLFEKCEMATQTASDTPMSDNFHNDLEAFVQHQERDRKPILAANDEETNELMIKAIQVMRIHLLELDKVQELCKDFCNRYITCLKGKMQSENLLRSDYYDNANGGSFSSPHSTGNSPHHSYSSNGDASISPPNNGYNNNNNNNAPSGFPLPPPLPTGNPLTTTLPHPHSHSHHQNNPGANSHLPGLGIPSSPENNNIPPPPPVIHGGTPLSQIGANICPPLSSQDAFVQNNLTSSPQTPTSSVEDDDDYMGMGRKKPKRGVLPKHATSIMRSWLFQHIVHPYPTEIEKQQIAAQTNLTLLQVNNWFINARRRILQPMLDASNPEVANAPKVKKIKTHGSKPALKYWSDNLASISSGNSSDLTNGINQNGDDSSEDSDGSSNDNDGNDLLINDNSDSSQHLEN